MKWRAHRCRSAGRKTFGPRVEASVSEARAYLRLAAARGEGARCRGRSASGASGDASSWAACSIRPFHEQLRRRALPKARHGARRSWRRSPRDLRAWHDTGFRHGDCYPKNVLLPDSGAPPLPLGCPAARFVARGTKADRRRRKDLAQWAAGVLEAAPEQSPFAFLEAYCQAPGLDAARLQKVVRPHFDRILKQKERRDATREAREGGTPPRPVPLREDATRSRRLALASLDQPQPH